MHLNTSLIYLYDFACRKILHYHREILNQSTRILNHFSPLNGHSNQLAYFIKQKKITHFYRILLSSNLKKQKDNLIETIFKPALVCFIFGWGGCGIIESCIRPTVLGRAIEIRVTGWSPMTHAASSIRYYLKSQMFFEQ